MASLGDELGQRNTSVVAIDHDLTSDHTREGNLSVIDHCSHDRECKCKFPTGFVTLQLLVPTIVASGIARLPIVTS